MAYKHACRRSISRLGHGCLPKAAAFADLMALSLSASRYRNYHPALGRWIERDPAGYVDGMSLYQYCGSNPAAFTDPTGLLGDPYDAESSNADENSAPASGADTHNPNSNTSRDETPVQPSPSNPQMLYGSGASSTPLTLAFAPPDATSPAPSYTNTQRPSFLDITLGNTVDFGARTATFFAYGSGAIFSGVFEDVFSGLAAIGSLPPGSVSENIEIGPATFLFTDIIHGGDLPIEVPHMEIPTGNIRRAASFFKTTFEETSAKCEETRMQAEATVEGALSKPYRGIYDTKEPDDLWSKMKIGVSKLMDEVTRPVVELEMRLRQYHGDDLF